MSPLQNRVRHRKKLFWREQSRYGSFRLLLEGLYHSGHVFYRMLTHRIKGHNVLLLYTMGKVGTSTVMASLKAAGVTSRFSSYWVHFLSKEGVDLMRRLQKDGYGGRYQIPISKQRDLYRRNVFGMCLRLGLLRGRRLKAITLVRDPVAANLSGFFQQHVWWPPELQNEFKHNERGSLYIKDLERRFFLKYPHTVPLVWFDAEIRRNLQIDVFAVPFMGDKGYQIYRSELAELLLIRLEDLSRCAGEAFKEFLNLDSFKLIESNIAREKWYSKLYQKFLADIQIPEAYLAAMYESKFARHFYSAEEIEIFMQKWRHPSSHWTKSTRRQDASAFSETETAVSMADRLIDSDSFGFELDGRLPL